MYTCACTCITYGSFARMQKKDYSLVLRTRINVCLLKFRYIHVDGLSSNVSTRPLIAETFFFIATVAYFY